MHRRRGRRADGMKFYLVSQRLEEAKKAVGFGFVHGLAVPRAEVVATGRDYRALVRELSVLPFHRICAQSDGLDARSLVDEARELADSLTGRFILLAPVTLESIRAAAELQGTLSFALDMVASSVQAVAAARAGAHAVCLPSRRFMSGGLDVCVAAGEMRAAFERYDLSTEVWVHDPRDAAELGRLINNGVDAVLCGWELLRTVAYHPFTDRGIERLLAEWRD